MRWGVIGTAGLASRCCVPGIKDSDEGELVAVMGRDPDRTKAFAAEHGAETAASTIDDFLSAPGLEAVWIATPTFLHHEQGLACLKADKHVLLEKPLATSSEEAWELVEAAEAADRVLATGYQNRYFTGHRNMAELVRGGAIGDVSVMRTYYGVHRGPEGPPEWRKHRESARWGALADIGTHHVDFIRFLLGEIGDVHSLTGHQLGYETEDVAVAGLRLESGALASLTVSVNVWTPSTRVEVHGTTGVLIAEDTFPAGKGTVTRYDSSGEPQDITGERMSVWAAQVDAVTRATRDPSVPIATGRDGARNIEILEQLG